MRRLPAWLRRIAAILALALSGPGCSEWRMRPLTAPYTADAPLLQEQALVGLDAAGNAAALQLVEAEGMPPSLTLWRLDRDGGPSRSLLAASPEVAAHIESIVRREGRKEAPLLLDAAQGSWPDAFARAHALGFERLLPDVPASEPHRHPAAAPGDFAGFLQTELVDGDPPAYVVLLREGDAPGAQAEIARQPVSGTAFQAGLFIRGPVAWLWCGSIAKGEPLRRTVALKRGSIAHGAAEIRLSHARTERALGNVEDARSQLRRALAADPRFVDALYAAAALEAVAGRSEEAVSLLRRAADVDARRVQVLGRDDADLVSLRGRQDVRKLLGLPRPPPAG